MHHITRMPAGWLYRRSLNGKLFRRFISDQKHGGREQSLEAAEKLAREIDEEYGAGKGKSGPRFVNSRNRSGIVGVSWTCRVPSNNPSDVRHVFRGQATLFGDDPEKRKVIQKSFSIPLYGLWVAYTEAAKFRFQNALSEMPDAEDLRARFIGFIETYIEEMQTLTPEAKAMEAALLHLYADENTPREVYDELPDEVHFVSPEHQHVWSGLPPIRLKP